MEHSSSGQSPTGHGLRARVITALVLAPPVVGLLWLGGGWTLALLILAGGMAAWEWFRLSVPHLAWSLTGLIYLPLAFCGIGALRLAPEGGFWLVMWLLLVVAATDTGAYFTGRALGGPKLAPRISPSKTWSGLLGGLVLACAVAFLVARLVPEANLPQFIWAGPLALVSQGGDLLESALKRRFGVKDSGRILPGHGGLLDRVDGLLAAGPVLWLLLWLGLA